MSLGERQFVVDTYRFTRALIPFPSVDISVFNVLTRCQFFRLLTRSCREAENSIKEFTDFSIIFLSRFVFGLLTFSLICSNTALAYVLSFELSSRLAGYDVFLKEIKIIYLFREYRK